MIKEIEISIPTSYGDISLKKWLELQKEIKNYEGNDEAISALLLYHLCGLEPGYLSGLSTDNYTEIKKELGAFLQKVELPLQRFITIDGKEYGFEPNLSKMSYGAYADVSKYNEITIDDNWPKIMNILYRPITHKKGELYSIEAYSGKTDYEKFLNVPMDVHFGALFFLLNLQSSLLSSILKSSMEKEALLNIKQILQRNGAHMERLLNWQKTIYSDLIKL
jgi:hypothetical protein